MTLSLDVTFFHFVFAMSAPVELPCGELAYEALRLAFIPWQRERRVAKEQERIRLARFSSRVIAGGDHHSFALRRDGRIACWGNNGFGRAPPEGVDGDFVAIAAGGRHSLALRRDGGIACWGNNDYGEAPPDGVTGPFGHVDV